MSITLGSSGIKYHDKSIQNNVSLGYLQSWTNVTSSRSVGTTYTNTTGRAITVAAYTNLIYTADIQAYVDGVLLLRNWFNVSYATGGAYEKASIIFIVPNGSTYSIQSTSLNQWFELR